MEIRSGTPPPRPVSRRGEPKAYIRERLSRRVSVSTASRWLDKAERDGLVDKTYELVDRRGTAARLTQRGARLRGQVERTLAGVSKRNDRPRGPCYGVRLARSWNSER